MQKISEKGAEE